MRDDPRAATTRPRDTDLDPVPLAAAPAAVPPARRSETARFLAKRGLIVDAASALINERGVRGLSLAEVGEQAGLGSTSVPYYFRRKEDLAAACFDRALDVLGSQVDEAATELVAA